MDDLLLGTALVLSGLTAGLFVGWSVSANPGLARVMDRTYVSAMQSINKAILNPVFFIMFMGTAVALVAAAIAHDSPTAGWLFAAAGTYVFGTLGVTIGGNVPLNNSLEAFDLEAAGEDDIAARRSSYEGPWVRWHNVRTAASLAAFVLAVVAALVG